MPSLTRNEEAWGQLFTQHRIVEEIDKNGYHKISARMINTIREARLMAKFDHLVNLPRIFKDNNLTILPISRSEYIIGKFDSYIKVEYDENLETKYFDPPSFIESIDKSNLYSESAALHYAQISGMINDLVEVETHFTISGRMSTGIFDFNINNIQSKNKNQIHIENSQCEIDGGFESENSLLLVEAKNYSVDDFIIRQLYYPYRLWKNKIRKPVIPVFMTYSNDEFRFFIYSFENLLEYNSIQLIKQKKYIIAPDSIELENIYQLLQKVKIKGEPKVPFPQADSFERIVDLLGILFNSDLSKDYITQNYQFDVRQTEYYSNAAIYLGLVYKYRNENRETSYALTVLGKEIMSKTHKEKYLSLVRCILEHEVFNKALTQYFQLLSTPNIDLVCEIMRDSHIYHVSSDSTFERRAQTVLSWIDWILNLPN